MLVQMIGYLLRIGVHRVFMRTMVPLRYVAIASNTYCRRARSCRRRLGARAPLLRVLSVRQSRSPVAFLKPGIFPIASGSPLAWPMTLRAPAS
jgi:hypothetical protein